MGDSVPFLLGSPRPRTLAFKSHSPVMTETQFRALITTSLGGTANTTQWLNDYYPMAINEQEFGAFMRVKRWTFTGSANFTVPSFGFFVGGTGSVTLNGTYPDSSPPPGTPSGSGSAQGWNTSLNFYSFTRAKWIYYTQERYLIGKNRWLWTTPGNNLSFVDNTEVYGEGTSFATRTYSGPSIGGAPVPTSHQTVFIVRTGPGFFHFTPSISTVVTNYNHMPNVYVDDDGDYHPFIYAVVQVGQAPGITFYTIPAGSASTPIFTGSMTIQFAGVDYTFSNKVIVAGYETAAPNQAFVTSATFTMQAKDYWTYNNAYDGSTGEPVPPP